MTEIGNRLGLIQVLLGVTKCWMIQKELDKVSYKVVSTAVCLTRLEHTAFFSEPYAHQSAVETCTPWFYQHVLSISPNGPSQPGIWY